MYKNELEVCFDCENCSHKSNCKLRRTMDSVEPDYNLSLMFELCDITYLMHLAQEQRYDDYLFLKNMARLKLLEIMKQWERADLGQRAKFWIETTLVGCMADFFTSHDIEITKNLVPTPFQETFSVSVIALDAKQRAAKDDFFYDFCHSCALAIQADTENE